MPVSTCGMSEETTSSIGDNDNSKLMLWALASAYVVQVTVFNLMPIFVTALMDKFKIAEADSGLLLTFELLVISLVPVLLARWATRLPLKKLLLSGAILAVLGNIASMVAVDTTTLLATRIFTGLGAGQLLLGANLGIAHTHDPVKSYGFVNTMGIVVALLSYLIMPELREAYGFAGTYGLLMVLGCAAFAFLLTMPQPLISQARGEEDRKSHGSVSGTTVVLLVVALFLVSCAYMAGYAMIDSIGINNALTAREMGNVLAVAQIMGLCGTVFATRLGSSKGIKKPLCVGLLFEALSLFTYTSTGDGALFIIATFVNAFTFLFIVPFLLGIGAELDHSGELAAVGAGVIYLGLSFGPAIGGFLVTGYGAQMLGIVALITSLIGMSIFVKVAPGQSILEQGAITGIKERQ